MKRLLYILALMPALAFGGQQDFFRAWWAKTPAPGTSGHVYGTWYNTNTFLYDDAQVLPVNLYTGCVQWVTFDQTPLVGTWTNLCGAISPRNMNKPTASVVPTWTNNTLLFRSANTNALQAGSLFHLMTNFTVAMWIKIGSASSGELLSKFAFSGSSFYINVNGSGLGTVSATTTANGNKVNHMSGVSTGVWHHIAFSCPSGGVITNGSWYLDGEPAAKTVSSSGGAVTADATTVRYGCRQTATTTFTAYFDGGMDDVTLFRTALTAGEIKTNLYLRTATVTPARP